MVARRYYAEEVASDYRCYLWTGPLGRWGSDNFTQLIRKYTKEVLGDTNAMTLSSSRQVLCGLYDVHCNACFRESEKKSDEEVMVDRLGAMQAGHTAEVARAHYAVELQHMNEMAEKDFRGMLIVSFFFFCGWHYFCHLPG